MTVLAMAITIDAQAASPAPGASAGAPAATFWRTRWAVQSHEPITTPVVTSRTLPATLSIDALTDAEIQTIRQDIYDRVKYTPPIDPLTHVAGADGCMQWVYQRWGRDQPWRTVGFRFNGGKGLIKLNGALRWIDFRYGIGYDLNDLVLKKRVRVVGSGGDADMETFTPYPSYAQAIASAASEAALQEALRVGEHGSRVRRLWFGSSNAIAIVQHDAPCSLLRARCRRYEFEATGPAHWQGFQRAEAPYGAIVQSEPVAPIADTPLGFAVEDMCPFAEAAMIERQYSRMSGRSSFVKPYGLPGNASLRDALRPYVK